MKQNVCYATLTHPAVRKMLLKLPAAGMGYTTTSHMVEHVKVADSFSQKSHIAKHWMTDHKDESRRPPFAYQDKLERQSRSSIVSVKTSPTTSPGCQQWRITGTGKGEKEQKRKRKKRKSKN